jgi:hypothetical protein
LSITLTKFAGSMAVFDPDGVGDVDGLDGAEVVGAVGDELAFGLDDDVHPAISAAPASATITFLSMASLLCSVPVSGPTISASC